MALSAQALETVMAVVWNLVVLDYLHHHASREHRHVHPLRKNDTSTASGVK